ncbi:MAG: sigma 54-interacting transcriptional regulator [Selenomonadaceae bacterium]|nr:sigma 54-interacting transcriptional regulator [Selenomonadaceae bacterium]
MIKHGISEQALLDALPCEIVVTDKTGKIIKANRDYCKAKNLSPDKILGKDIKKISGSQQIVNALEYPTETKLIFRENEDLVVLSNIFSETELRGALEMRFHSHGAGSAGYMELNYSNMTEDIHKLFETNWDVIYASDGDGITLEVSSAANSIWGVDAKFLVGNSVYDLEREKIYYPSITRMVLESKRRVQAIQTTATGKKLLVMGTPIQNEAGKIIRVINTSRIIPNENDLSKELEETRLLLDGYKRELALSRLQEKENNSFIAASPEMQKVFSRAMKVSETDVAILITGESGVGKEVLANLIATKSRRADKPYIKINCSAIPPTLFESELFGYERGAFTGAERSGKPGLFELANHGTLFLDEISEIPINMQAKFLRVLQENEFMRVGGTKLKKLDVRIIAATNKNLLEEIERGNFRKDLYYRLNVVQIHIPPLHERREDILPLSLAFLEKYNRKYNLDCKFSPEVMDAFFRYSWDGNVRELQHAVERMVVLSPQSLIGVESLPEALITADAGEVVHVNEIIPLKEAQKILEKKLLAMARRKFKTTTAIAEALGINQSTVSRKLSKK